MKHLSKFLVAFLFLVGFTVQAQNEDNPWAIGIGTNAVDFYPVGGGMGEGTTTSETFFNGFFDTDHFNIMPSFSRLSVARYIGAGFTFELAGSINSIDMRGDVAVDDLTYYAFGGTLMYSFRNLINSDGWFDPYLGVGGGYMWLDDIGSGVTNGTLGFNFWLSDNIALNVQTTYKSAGEEGFDHFQHVAGIKFAFGGKDTDGDGIYDEDDDCVDVPGLAAFNGCPDSDGDGIPDGEDACADTPGLAKFDGCPDTDGDGVPDPDDNCVTVAGLASMNGCPDADRDGVIDSEDGCPDEAGPAENNGCPYEDRDNDSVLDKDDQCPDEAGTVANNGCPEVNAEVIGHLNEYSKTILFDLNKSSIRKSSYDALDAIVDIMKEYENAEFHIAGFTDSSGRSAYNLKLSKERAASVRSYLVSHGIEAGQITSEGYGEQYPIATNKTAAGRQQNRRVEVSLQKNMPGSNE